MDQMDDKNNPEMSIEMLLRTWDVPERIIDRFQENEIKLNQLNDLSEDILKELCPIIGTRILIKSKLNEYFTTRTDNATTVTTLSDVFDQSKSDVDLNELDTIIIPVDKLANFERPPFPDFDLRTLLSTSPCGNSIINYYKSHNTLTSKHRNQLVDIIVRHVFTRIVNHKITHEEYNFITGKIIVLFPRENSGTYFVPPVKKNESFSGKPLFAKGKLVDKIKNTLYKSGEKRKSKTEIEQGESTKKNRYLEDLRENKEDHIAFLRNNTEPWAQVIDYWLSTYPLRECSNKPSVAEFLEEWNILNDPRGEVLINLDFDQKYKENSTNFYTKWHPFINKIISIKFDSSRDDTLASLYENIRQQPDEDQIVPDQIKLLSKGRINKRKRTKFSTLECIENFYVAVDSFGDIDKKIENLQVKSRMQKQTLQPFLISCMSPGTDNQRRKYYLVIDKVKYRFDTATKAFDTLFKSYHTLHATYPAAAAHLYLLIQRCVYGIETKYDNVVPYISDIMSLAQM